MPNSFKYSMNVRFIRAEDVEGSGKNDDRAVITNEDGDVFTLTFHHNDGKKAIVKEMMLDSDGVVSWFNRTFRFVDADYVPYARYQFDFPMMPSIMIAHQELHHHHKVIMSAVRFHLENWMVEDSQSSDSEEDNYVPSDSDSDDEYADMPVNTHTFFNEDGTTNQVKAMVQRMEKQSTSSASNFRGIPR